MNLDISCMIKIYRARIELEHRDVMSTFIRFHFAHVQDRKEFMMRFSSVLKFNPKAFFSAAAVNAVRKEPGVKSGPIRRVVPTEAGTPPLVRTKTLPVTAMCMAESFDFPKLKQHLLEQHQLSNFISDDVLHARLRDGSGEAFFFQSGSFVFWPAGKENGALKALMDETKPFQIGPVQAVEQEELEYREGDDADHATGIRGETMVIAPRDRPQDVMIKLAFSNGLADSVKLATLEAYLERHIEKTSPIPEMLRSGGKLALSRAQVLQLIGELLHFRSVLNLQSELLDTPELYWSEPELESLYLRTSRVLETRTRIAVLNKKLDYAGEMAAVLRSHLSEAHGLKLEWGIIALIAVEVLFELLHMLR